jgi:hypothetical protein
MDKEFHFYVTYIIAQRAGFGPEDSYRIAYSSQYTDDNTRKYTINSGQTGELETFISQTVDITQPQEALIRIYPVFHFMPGAEADLFADSARRRDGKLHLLNTIPNGQNSRMVLQTALDIGNSFRIGIAAHLYADTFSHQNFLGYKDGFNSLIPLSPFNIGHAEALHKPDYMAAVWHDTRLVLSRERIDNKWRFLQAVACLFNLLKKGSSPTQGEVDTLVNSVSKAIGQRDDGNELSDERIERFKTLIQDFVDYDKYEWLDQAVAEKAPDPLPTPDYPQPSPTFIWKRGYKNSNWYQFHLAVKDHQSYVMDQIIKPIFNSMEVII